MFRYIVAIFLALSLLWAIGCTDQEKVDLKATVSTQKADNDKLTGDVAALKQSTEDYRGKIFALQSAYDTLMQKNEASQKLAKSLKAQLAKQEAKIDSLKDKVDELMPANVMLPVVQEKLVKEEAAHKATRAERDSLLAKNASWEDLVNRIRPWYLFYKHDATQRNVFEHFFGADKAKKPGGTESNF
ncbi:MAG: hypothetical protein WCT08_06270 [Patescibacteria group bacterium]|jgi:chromosome segregation ATPase